MPGRGATDGRLVRALQDQGGRAHIDHDPRAAAGCARRGRVEHVPVALGPGDDRPAHGLRDECDERPAVGGAHGRGRGLCGKRELLPPPGDGAAALRLPARHPDPPGPRGGAHRLGDADPRGRHDPRQHVLHDDTPASRARRRDVRGRHLRGRPRSTLPSPVQGRRGCREAREGDRTGRPRAVPLDRRDGEHGRRAADLDGEPAGRAPDRRRPRHHGDLRRDAGPSRTPTSSRSASRATRSTLSPRSSSRCAA